MGVLSHGGVVFSCWFAFAGAAAADTIPVVLNTGAGQPLQTETRLLTLDPGLAQPRLEFNFGFATDELFTPNTFQDSFTVTIQTTDQQFTAVYLTADASGMVLGPPTPGALAIAPSSITSAAIAYPALTPQLHQQTAFAVSAAIPPQFQGTSMNVFFDLFDNGDAAASQGWFSGLQVTQIPEPQSWSLVFAVMCVWGIAKMRR